MTYIPSEEQKKVITASGSALINAPPGTGKTVTALAFAREKSRSLKDGQKVLFLSFSNSAVKRMAEAAGLHLTKEDQKHVSFATYHAVAWNITRQYGRFAGLPSRVQILDNVELSVLPLRLLNEKSLSDKEYLHEAATKLGLVHFDVMLSAATKILQASPTIQALESLKFPFIVVDEFQDTTPEQFNFLKLLGEKSDVLAFGDTNQIIFDREHSQAIQQQAAFQKWKSLDRTISFGRNFRCSKTEILEFADCVVHGRKFDAKRTDTVICAGYFNSNLRSQLATIWVAVERDDRLKGKTIGVLTPSMAISQQICLALRNPPKTAKLKIALFPRVTLKEEQKDGFRLALAAIQQLRNSGSDEDRIIAAEALCAMRKSWSPKSRLDERAITDARKELSPPASKKSKETSLYQLVKGPSTNPQGDLDALLLDALDYSKLFKSVAATIRSTGFRFINSELRKALRADRPFQEYLETREAKGLLGSEVPNTQIEVLSMYRAKGREFDVVVIVSDPYVHTGASLAATRRLYYVGATRARELLVILHRAPGRHVDAVFGPVLGI